MNQLTQITANIFVSTYIPVGISVPGGYKNTKKNDKRHENPKNSHNIKNLKINKMFEKNLQKKRYGNITLIKHI